MEPLQSEYEVHKHLLIHYDTCKFNFYIAVLLGEQSHGALQYISKIAMSLLKSWLTYARLTNKTEEDTVRQKLIHVKCNRKRTLNSHPVPL